MDNNLSYEERVAIRCDETKKAIEKVIDLLNVMGGEEETVTAVLQAIQGQHRTLQANWWRMIKGVATAYGKTDRFDLRNEAAVKLCQKIGDIDQHVPFI